MKKSVNDLGIASYMMMKGFKVMGRAGRDILFKVEKEKFQEFDRKHLDYLASEFHRFDSCIMALKKIPEMPFSDRDTKFVTDLGVAAYIMMHQYRIMGKSGKSYYFEVDEESAEKFDDLALEYLSSDFHNFDSCLMSLKKISEYVTEK